MPLFSADSLVNFYHCMRVCMGREINGVTLFPLHSPQALQQIVPHAYESVVMNISDYLI